MPGPGSAADGEGRELNGVPRATLTTGLKIGGTAKDSGAAGSISASYQDVTFDLSGITGFATAACVAIRVRSTDVVDLRAGSAGDAAISEADKWSDLIYVSQHTNVASSIKLKSAAGTVLQYQILVF